jgi:hypothetical protein
MAKKFITTYLKSIQSDLQKPENSKVFDFIKTSLKPSIEASFNQAPPFMRTIASSAAKSLYDSVEIKTFIPNLIKNITELPDAGDLGAIAGIPFGLPHKTYVKEAIQNLFRDLKPDGLPDNIADIVIPILLNNRDAALINSSPPAPWSSSTEYPVGSIALNQGVKYEKVADTPSPSANTTGKIWKKASGGGHKTKVRRVKGRKPSRRR